jgi:hypothetical protein
MLYRKYGAEGTLINRLANWRYLFEHRYSSEREKLVGET